MKLLNIFMFFCLVTVLLVGGLVLYPHYCTYRNLRGDLSATEKTLAERQQEVMQLRKEIEDLRKDRRAIERVAREKFGWCREGETIYHFDATGSLGPTVSPSRGR